MNPEFWHERWRTGETRFHQSEVEPKLIQYFTGLATGKIMVPLCGKSLDLIWLRDQGHEVIGVELDSIACESFFSENKISFQKRIEGKFAVYESNRLTLWCGDFFQTPAQAWVGVTAIYDRAAMIALPTPLREKYTQTISKKFTEISTLTQLLLLTIEYSQDLADGPPFSISEAEVNRLYANTVKVKKMETESDQSLVMRSPQLTTLPASEHVFMLTRK